VLADHAVALDSRVLEAGATKLTLFSLTFNIVELSGSGDMSWSEHMPAVITSPLERFVDRTPRNVQTIGIVGIAVDQIGVGSGDARSGIVRDAEF